MFTRFSIAAWMLFASIQIIPAQISPPGLGKTNSAGWFALGLDQQIHPRKKVRSVTYAGLGAVSTFACKNPFQCPAILVINQEFYHRFHRHWEYSAAASYRRQNIYGADGIREDMQQELRLYGRFSYILDQSGFSFKTTIRQEVRGFFEKDFSPAEENVQFRTRIKTQIGFKLDKENQYRITLSAEELFSFGHEQQPYNRWESYHYSESRFCAYFTYAPPGLPVIIDLGYMNDLSGTGTSLFDAQYLALDIVLKNPF